MSDDAPEWVTGHRLARQRQDLGGIKAELNFLCRDILLGVAESACFGDKGDGVSLDSIKRRAESLLEQYNRIDHHNIFADLLDMSADIVVLQAILDEIAS